MAIVFALFLASLFFIQYSSRKVAVQSFLDLILYYFTSPAYFLRPFYNNFYTFFFFLIFISIIKNAHTTPNHFLRLLFQPRISTQRYAPVNLQARYNNTDFDGIFLAYYLQISYNFRRYAIQL